MKKLFFALVAVLLMANAGFAQNKPKPGVIFKFRYHCDAQIGICLRIPLFQGDLTDELIKDGYGQANISMVGGKLQVDLNAPAATKQDPSIIIDEAGDIGKVGAQILGFSSVIVKKGTYKVDFSKSQFGTVIFDVDTK